ncbi:MAG TPA: sulfite exporter TauE/SafE family protein [Gaiellaceae bacterium]|nr:sulfite exporter TauE/SafE family protein [Gaiellaceae bacterium]
MTLLAGGLLLAGAALLAGASGFGFGLLATPSLLLAGFSLPFVVTVNLVASLLTRASIAYRFRAHVDRRRVCMLVGGSVPGLVLGAQLLTRVDPRPLKIAVGALVMAVSSSLALRRSPEPRTLPGGTVVAGFAGGLLTTTTSLSGVPPVLLLARQRLAAAVFYADLAVYFVAAAAIGLAVLAASHGLSTRALYPAALLWLPGILVANAAGASLGIRLEERRFRQLTAALAFAAGALTVASA